MKSIARLLPKAALQGADQLFHPAALMLLAPHLITRLGGEAYSLLALSIMSYGLFVFLCPNIASTIYARLPEYLRAESGRRHATSLVTTLSVAITLSVTVTWTLLVVCAGLVPSDKLLAALSEFGVAFPLLIYALLFNLDQALSALTRIAASIETASITDLAGKGLGWALLLTALQRGETNVERPLDLLSVFSACLTATIFTKLFFCRHVIDGASIGQISPDATRDIISTALWPWVLTISITTFAQADQFVMSALFTGVAAGHVVFLSLIGRTVHSLTSATFAFLFPYLSTVSPDSLEGMRTTRHALIANLPVTVVFALTLYFIGTHLLVPLDRWAATPTHAELLAFIGANAVLSLHVAAWNHLMATGAFRRVSLTLLLAGVINVMTVAFLSGPLGAHAIWLGRLIAGVLMLPLIVQSYVLLRNPPRSGIGAPPRAA